MSIWRQKKEMGARITPVFWYVQYGQIKIRNLGRETQEVGSFGYKCIPTKTSVNRTNEMCYGELVIQI